MIYTVFVTDYKNKRIVDETTHEFDTLERAFQHACEIPSMYYVSIMDEEGYIWLDKTSASVLDWNIWETLFEVFINHK